MGGGVLEATEVGADLGVGPVSCSDEFAADEALAINDVGFRPHVGVEEFRRGLVGVADRDQIHMMAQDEAAVGAGIVVDADGQDGEVRVVVVELQQRGQFFDAGGAFAPPEIQEHDFTAIVGQVD